MPATETLAERMFTAEFGHTGLSYDSLSEDARGEWERKASRVLEGLYDSTRPFIVIDLREDELWLSAFGGGKTDAQE